MNMPSAKNFPRSKSRVITGDWVIDLLLGISLEALKDAIGKPKSLTPDELDSAKTFIRDCPSAYCDIMRMEDRLYRGLVQEVCHD